MIGQIFKDVFISTLITWTVCPVMNCIKGVKGCSLPFCKDKSLSPMDMMNQNGKIYLL